MPDPSLNVRLTGTEEEVAPPRILTAGPLSAVLEAGNLRWIRYGGVEVIRAVSFIVRDRDWGTYNPAISDLSIDESGDGFRVSYAAMVGDGTQRFRYRARIDGRPQRLVFAAEGEADGDFVTNRTGFVVLHPADAAGLPVTIERVDGSVEEGRFPELIDPVQPMMDLRTLTHEPIPGVRVACRMEGDTFEMEDQRNWTDASYKTYVRPLALPWPYTLKRGERIAQSVTLAFTGAAPTQAKAGGSVRLALGAADRTMPAIGVGLVPEEVAASRQHLDALSKLGVRQVVCHYDPRRAQPADLAAMANLARDIGADPWLELVVQSVEGFEEEVAAVGRAAADAGAAFTTVLVSPASDLKSTLPGSVWPPAPPADAVYRAARAAFPDARIGGGMFSYFTELNRKRPPIERLDLIGFTTSPIVHAGDDHTVMENLATLPYVARSARAFSGDRPLCVGPSAIGMRMNPYGAAPMENPNNIRQAMNRADPRQRGLLGAAWTIGTAARLTPEGIAALTFGATTGPHGLVATRQSTPQPWYDEHPGALFPAYHAVRALAGWSGVRLRAIEVSNPTAVAALAGEMADGLVLLVANLLGEPVTVELGADIEALRTLDADDFVAAATDPDFLGAAEPASGRTLALGPYAVARALLR